MKVSSVMAAAIASFLRVISRSLTQAPCDVFMIGTPRSRSPIVYIRGRSIYWPVGLLHDR
jgi:hypothetical protein